MFLLQRRNSKDVVGNERPSGGDAHAGSRGLPCTGRTAEHDGVSVERDGAGMPHQHTTTPKDEREHRLEQEVRRICRGERRVVRQPDFVKARTDPEGRALGISHADATAGFGPGHFKQVGIVIRCSSEERLACVKRIGPPGWLLLNVHADLGSAGFRRASVERQRAVNRKAYSMDAVLENAGPYGADLIIIAPPSSAAVAPTLFVNSAMEPSTTTRGGR